MLSSRTPLAESRERERERERERDAVVCFKKVRSFKFSVSDRAEALSSTEPGPVDPTLTYSDGWKWNGIVHLVSCALRHQ